MKRSAVFIGQGRLLIACAERWLADGHAIDAIISTAPEISDWARGQNLSCVQTPEAFTATTDYLFSVVNHAVLSDAVLGRARLAAINFHDSPLPRYAGFNATSWAIRDGEAQHGVTWHLMSALADSGAILVQQVFDILDDDTAYTLSVRCDEAGLESFETLMAKLSTGAPDLQPVRAAHARQDFRLRHQRPGLGIVRFDQAARDVLAHIRALDFGRDDSWMARAKLDTPQGLFVIEEARLVPPDGASPGIVIALSDARLVIAALDGALEIERLTTLDGAPVRLSATGLATGDRLTVRDAARAQQEADADAAFSPQERVWVRRLATRSPPDLPELRAQSGKPDIATLDLPDADRLSALTDDAKSRVLMAALAIYVARTSDQTDFDIALAKPVPEVLKNAYAASTPLRLKVKPNARGSDVLEMAAAELRLQARHGHYARDVVTRYRVLRDAPPIPASPVVLQMGPQAADGAHDALSEGASIALAVSEAPHWVYDRRAMGVDAFTRFAARISGLVTQLMDRPETLLTEFDLLTPGERVTITETWQQTAAPVLAPQLIHRLFEAQAARTPDAIALVFRGAAISYRDLNARADVLATRLQARGVGPDTLVGVCLNRSIEMMIALLGVLKAGGAYVPMDPAYPRERLMMMCEDARPPVILTTRAIAAEFEFSAAATLFAEDFPHATDGASLTAQTEPHHLAYVIFTSGSTGRPKGVMVTHANAANFFTGMDQRLGTEPGTWLAATSISFDISVLELFWTLARGFKVILQPETDRASLERAAAVHVSSAPMDFSLFYFAASAGTARNPYHLLIEGAKFADTHGFSAVWTPERHFHDFGGPYPNPALTSAALATITSNVALRAGSVVLPLHNPIRVAEDWALIDQLSNGRTGLSFASGWHANDFALMPEAYDNRRDLMRSHIDTVLKLWRGEAVPAVSGNGKAIEVKTYPRPVQAKPPLWFTAAGSPESFRLAGEMGANLLTNMLGQDLADLKSKIAMYHAARRAAGHEGRGTVSVMLHTFVCADTDEARETARAPFCNYLMSSYDLIKVAPSMFPAFRQPSLAASDDSAYDAGRFTDDDLKALMDHAFERYFETAGLFGSPQNALRLVESLKAIGVTEVACLVDFGIDDTTVIESLVHLDQLRLLANSGAADSADEDLSLADAIHRHGVTHFQCTPSAARLLAASPEGVASLARLETLLVGGEALPSDLAQTLTAHVKGRILNMYGPTETTVWSTVSEVVSGAPVTIGTPIANTVIRILDAHRALSPVGVAGELCIGGAGVVRGYLGRDDLTAERFITDPLDTSGRLYRTGDLARFRHDGAIDFIGRIDGQVKVNGYRIELGEIETVLAQHPRIASAVVTVRLDHDAPSLAAYVIPANTASNDNADISTWQTLWDDAYRASQSADARFDVSGWTSRLTGEPIAANDMRAWLDETVHHVLALRPKRVLEIGCGTGMVLFGLIDQVEHYTGVDLSAAALTKIHASLTPQEQSKVRLEQVAAHALGSLGEDRYDTIILNSVVQYFPDAAYLERVIESAREKLLPNGRIFIGDVRWLEVLGAFQTAAVRREVRAGAQTPDLRSEIERRIQQEPELLLSPDFFNTLSTPGLTGAAVSLKQHEGALELNGFRFDVVLCFDAAPVAPIEPIVSAARTADDILGGLNTAPFALRVNNLLNTRLASSLAAYQTMCAGGTPDADETPAVSGTALSPANLRALHAGYAATLLPAANGDPGLMDVLFVRKDKAAEDFLRGRPTQTRAPARANTPWRGERADASLIDDLRAHLAARLPAYMLPASITTLAAFPLTPNGKVDRKALPAPLAAAASEARTFFGAANSTQEKIARVWKALLGLAQISVRDNLFDIGANSLLTVQAGQRLSVLFDRKISLVSLFRYPTIESLAVFLDGDETATADAAPGVRAARQQSAAEKRRQMRQARES